MSLERLRGGLIVSVQAQADSLLNTPDAIALLARVAEANGAAGVRIEGMQRIAAVCAAVAIPVIGIIKHAYEGFAPYITPTLDEVNAIVAAGAAVVAFDATPRARPGGATVEAIVAAIRAGGALAMADCAELSDGARAVAAGADIVATTLCGYTDETREHQDGPPCYGLLRELARLGSFAICEGRIGTPADVRDAFAVGADAVVVGTAITNIDVLVRRFVRFAPQST